MKTTPVLSSHSPVHALFRLSGILRQPWENSPKTEVAKEAARQKKMPSGDNCLYIKKI